MAYYYTRDHLGSVREMCNSSGNIVSRYGYDPYGAPPPGYSTNLISGTNLATKQYANYYVHATSGLYLTKYRAFDSNAERWLSRDPLPAAEMAQGPNLYEYVQNEPVNAYDSLGLCELDLTYKDFDINTNLFNYLAPGSPVNSLQDLTDRAVTKAFEECCCIRTLTIWGHGAPGNISVGAGITQPIVPAQDQSLKIDTTYFLLPLKKFFCKNARLVLEGCDVGSGSDGQELMQKLANQLGVSVTASYGPVSPIFGNYSGISHTRP
jgi:RHS repeat-associated protein